jgi:16S rRNA (guanine1516-N2)-methyltransferase
MRAVSEHVVVAAAEGFAEQARAEARRLGLPFAAEAAEGLALRLDGRGWGLVDLAAPRQGAVRAEFVEGPLGARLRRGVGRGDRLAKALGVARHPGQRVLDATAGLGRDAVVAAALGCEVTACERSPAVALLLRDGLARAAADPAFAPIVGRMDVRAGDAVEVMRGLAEGERPDAVLVDPMFPERPKAARAKKEMDLLRRLLGPDADLDRLLEQALATARRRVVVKRPLHTPAAGPRRPDLVVPGRAARFDVYLRAPASG